MSWRRVSCAVVGVLGDGQALLPFLDVLLDQHVKKRRKCAVRHLCLAVGLWMICRREEELDAEFGA